MVIFLFHVADSWSLENYLEKGRETGAGEQCNYPGALSLALERAVCSPAQSVLSMAQNQIMQKERDRQTDRQTANSLVSTVHLYLRIS